MKKICPLVLALFVFSGLATGATGDTTIIIAHTHTNLASPPTDYNVWVNFPNTGVTYQKVLMKFTLGCGTPNCSGWDYTVNTELGKKSGTLDSTVASIDTLNHDTTWNYSDHVDYIEVGRLITPYGTYMANNSNGFNNSWTQPYYYDVTDYAQFLKDSTVVKVHYDGWTDAFSANVEFIFIEGPPSRSVENVQQVYHGGYGYSNSADFENQVNVKTFYIAPGVTSAKVVVDMTGHGGQGEFDPENFHIKINSNEIYSRLLWKDDCGLNALYPQGGTWLLNRANWCPGEKVRTFEVDITPYITPGQNVTVDLDMDDFTQTNGVTYGLSMHLITYSSQKDNDVMMEEIIAPNHDKPYVRFNPISTRPIVQIKNMGKNNLTYAQIAYWVSGGDKWYYEWHGNLPPFESERVTLPAFDWNGMDNTHTFYAEASWPNGVPDEYAYNNQLVSAFDTVPRLDSVFFIYFKSNNHPEEDWYNVTNEDGDTIDAKSTFAATTVYQDTLHLQPGSYAFNFYDYDAVNWEGGDGLQWWFNQQSTSDPWYETTGGLLLKKLGNAVITNFQRDFGNNVHYEFTVGYNLGYNPAKPTPVEPVHNTGIVPVEDLHGTMEVFPNPATDYTSVALNFNRETGGKLLLTDLQGRVIKTFSLGNSAQQHVILYTGNLAPGIYLVSFTSESFNASKKLVINN